MFILQLHFLYIKRLLITLQILPINKIFLKSVVGLILGSEINQPFTVDWGKIWYPLLMESVALTGMIVVSLFFKLNY